MPSSTLPAISIDLDRLMADIEQLALIGHQPDVGGNSRLALSDADRTGRDTVVRWMQGLQLDVSIDQIGNIIAVCPGTEPQLAPLMVGSHIDTVANGGKYDGNYGVLAGLEVVRTLRAHGIKPRRGFAVAVFTNEEGVRFAPNMMGSLVYAGGMALADALAAVATDGARFGDELERIGYSGTLPCGAIRPSAYLELHVEQGPILEHEGVTIGAVADLQGIVWHTVTVRGQANHAGTTPLALRKDAGLVAAAILTESRRVAEEIPGLLATCGSIAFLPGLANVIPREAQFMLDVRCTDEATLRRGLALLEARAHAIAAAAGLTVSFEKVAWHEPVVFDAKIVDLVEETARQLGLSVRRMTSGAGHDAQMLARVCPAGMIFVPSVGGISHNPHEFTAPADLEAGANVLLHSVLQLTK